jgi:hypothetical protein
VLCYVHFNFLNCILWIIYFFSVYLCCSIFFPYSPYSMLLVTAVFSGCCYLLLLSMIIFSYIFFRWWWTTCNDEEKEKEEQRIKNHAFINITHSFIIYYCVLLSVRSDTLRSHLPQHFKKSALFEHKNIEVKSCTMWTAVFFLLYVLFFLPAQK